MKQKNLILMVVAVGCGLVAAFLTSQMSAKGHVEQVDVYVAAKDLPVGTLFTPEDTDKYVKVVKRPKDGLSPKAITADKKDALVGKRLSRPIRNDETLDEQDLTNRGVIMLPDGYHLSTMSINPATGGGGFVGPGDRVNIIATLQTPHKLLSFKLLVNVLVLAVDTNTALPDKGVYAQMNTVSFAVTEKQAQLLALAKHRGCHIELLLLNQKSANPDDNKDYDIEKVNKLLSDEKVRTEVVADPEGKGDKGSGDKNPGNPTATAGPTPQPITPPQPKEVARVLVAKRDLPANTEITADLIKDAFEAKEIPKEYAGASVGDLNPWLGKSFPRGVLKDQTVLPGMIGDKEMKPSPQDPFVAPKPGSDQKPGPTPVPVAPAPTPVKKRYHDVTLVTASGVVVHRYELLPNGGMQKVAELTPEQAAKDPNDAPAPAPGGKKRD